LNPAFVADASVGFAWVYHGQATPETHRLLEMIKSGTRVIVPAFWFLEISNILLVAQRRNRISVAQRNEALEKLAGMQFTVDEDASRRAFNQISDLAEKHNLSVYDAVYLDLALRYSVPLASRDGSLNTAAGKCGIKSL
jgi:predicted nucleic acid-binding protein